MNKIAKFTFAVIGSALLSQGAHAQRVPATQSASSASIPGAESGVVYPGPQGQAAVVQAGQPVTKTLKPGAPGTPLVSGGVPALPALPGEVSPTHQAVDDALPEDMAEQILILKQRLENVMRVSQTPVNTSAKPRSSHVELTQQPSEDTPIVRLAQGVPTNVIFTDVTGAPWPIEYVVPGTGGNFEAMVPAVGSPTMQLRPKAGYSYGGVAVKLVDNPIPVSITIAAAQKIVDVRLDVVVLKRGPGAKAPMLDSGSTAGMPADTVLTSFLYGIAPDGAKELKSSSRHVKGWTFNGLMYVRSAVPLVSPNPIRSSRTVDGTYAYVFTQVPIVNITADGVISSVSMIEQ